MSDLLHAVARVRALEAELLTPLHVDRMISASSFSDAYAVLDDLGYANEAAKSRKNLDFELVLESGLYESRQAFSSFGLEKVFSVLTVLWDIQNIKLAIKAFKSGDSEDSLLGGCIRYGSFTAYEVASAVYHSLGLADISDLISQGKNADTLREMESVIEDGLLKRASLIAGDNSFLKKYISIIKESEDIKTLLAETADIELVSNTYPSSLWAFAFSKGKSSFEKSKNFSFLENQIDIVILDFLKKEARGSIDTYAPLFSFFWRKERNARVIRGILLAKRAGLTPLEIRSEFIPFEF